MTTFDDQQEAYQVYEQLITVLESTDAEIALLALAKCRNEIMLHICEDEALYNRCCDTEEYCEPTE